MSFSYNVSTHLGANIYADRNLSPLSFFCAISIDVNIGFYHELLSRTSEKNVAEVWMQLETR